MKRAVIIIFVCLTAVLSGAGVRQIGTGFAQTQTPVVQPRYALLVGITNYRSPDLNKIDGCENNVPLLAQTLIDSYGFPKANVRTLLDTEATKAGILNAFKTHLVDNARKAKQSGNEAVVVYYFCGHGSQYPDQDKDENDGLDETFVAYDSRTAATADILDDEIDDLKADLRPLTTNTTLILESCHSGTGSRGDNDEHQFIDQEADADTKKYPAYKRRHPPSSDADAYTYTEISASASMLTAKSESKQYCDCDKPYSLMTKALVEALNRANHTTTYRTLGREIAAVVANRSRQDPRVEGNRDTLLFGGAAKRTKPYIEIERLVGTDQAVIKAGAIHGLKAGSQVSVYDPSSTVNAGGDGWLTNGVVTDVRAERAVVQFPSAAANNKTVKVTVASHVVLTSPVFGGGPLLVSLDVPAAGSTADPLAAQVRERLKADGNADDQMITLVAAATLNAANSKDASGVIRLRKDKFKAAIPDRLRSMAQVQKPTTCTTGDDGSVIAEKVPGPETETEIYFLDDGTPGDVPLYGRYFRLGDDNAAGEIARLIRNYALRANLMSINNAASTLPSQITVTANRLANASLADKCVDGRLERGLAAKPKAADFQVVKDGRIPVGSVFNFKVKNISGELRRRTDEYAAGEPLHIAAIYLLNNGDIDVIYPRLGANDPLGDGIERSFGGYIASKPAGAEHLILIVSKQFVDFSFYSSVGTRRDPQSALERLLKRSGTKTRDSAALIPDQPDSWGVIRVDLDIVDGK